MVSADENRPIATSGPVNGKAEQPGKRPEKGRRKPAQKSAPTPDALPEARQPMDAPIDASSASVQSSPVPESTSVPSPSMAVAPAASMPVSVQVITDAYGNYTRRSLEQTSSFFERLAGVRSLQKAIELQTEFAQQSFQTLMTESQKILGLHRELAKQQLKSLEGFVMGKRPTPRREHSRG